MHLETRYVILSEACSLRLLEKPCVFNRETDELYELDMEAFEFLSKCDGSVLLKDLKGDPEFVGYCFSEGILSAIHDPHVRHHNVQTPPAHTLRYLELHITGRCNLRCGHCYLNAGTGPDMELRNVFRVMDEFDAMQGLRLLISGGEPLMNKGFWYVNERLPGFGFRSVLMTNGTLINKDVAKRLKVDEAQVSLDGMGYSHDILRGQGSFGMAVDGIKNLTEAGVPVSVATTLNAHNMRELPELGRLIEELGVGEWNVDMPTVTGRFADNRELHIRPEDAAAFMSEGFGGCNHGGADGYACGPHLCAVGVSGQVAKCGFYMDTPVGNIAEGLRTCWERLKPIPLASLTCDCEHIDTCRGGCRFRAASFTGELGPDPVRCHSLGVGVPLAKGGELHDYREGG